MGVRLGSEADGSRAQLATCGFSTAPELRKARVRELLAFLRADGQVGLPPTIATDASLGYSAMAYQGAKVVFGHPDADRFILARFEVTAERRRSWPSGRRPATALASRGPLTRGFHQRMSL